MNEKRLLEQKISLLESQIEDYKLRESYQKKKTDSIFSNLNKSKNDSIIIDNQFENEVKKIEDN